MICNTIQGQGVTPEGVKIALDRMLFTEENNQITLNTLTKVEEAVKAEGFNAQDYDKLKAAYKTLEGNYNRVYLARMKQDLTNYKQLKSLTKNPNKHMERYAEDLNTIIDIYNNTFMPAAMSIIEKKRTRSFDLNFDGDGPRDDCDGDGELDENELDCDDDGIPDDCDTDDCDCDNTPDCHIDKSVAVYEQGGTVKGINEDFVNENEDDDEDDDEDDGYFGSDDDGYYGGEEDEEDEDNYNGGYNGYGEEEDEETKELAKENSRLVNEGYRIGNENSRLSQETARQRQDLEMKNLKTDLLSNKINLFSSAFQVVQTGLDIVNNTTQMVQDTRRERRNMVQLIADEADRMFDNISMPSWESLELERPGGGGSQFNSRKNRRNDGIANSEEEDEEYKDEPYEENEEDEYANYQREKEREREREEDEDEDYIDQPYEEDDTFQEKGNSYQDEEAPPANAILVESISGEIFFEVFDTYSGRDHLMAIQNGTGTSINVPRYDIETDLIVGTRPTAQLMSMETSVHPIETVESYPAGTYYRVKANGDAYIYAFSINSGNKMFGFYPYQGGIEEIPFGIRYTTPHNTYFGIDDASVCIPDRENYILIANTPGKRVPVSETLVVLFSRSELDLKDIFRRMERMSGRMSAQERLGHIFGSTAATPEEAGVSIVNDKLRFNLSGDNKVVLPIVYAIKRR